MLNQRTITLVSLSLKHVYEDQMRLQKKSDLKKESEKKKTNENQKEKKKVEKNERENKRTNSTIKRKIKRKTNFYAKMSKIKRVVFLNQLMIVLLYKVAYLNTNKLNTSFPSLFVSLL